MTDIAKILGSTLNLTPEAQKLVQEAWESKLLEARDEIAAELREEFAQKFEHDKDLIVESMDKFVSTRLESEIQELANDRKALAEERVKYKTQVREHVKALDKFITEQVSKEISEHQVDRKDYRKGLETLENFVLKQLAEEIKEFRADKQELQEQRVRLVREGRQQLSEAKRNFLSQAAALVESTIDAVLRKEIEQYRADIEAARQNDFGRRMFEAFAAEYMTSYLNEGSEVKKLMKVLEQKDSQINEAASIIEKQKNLNEGLASKLNATKDQLVRDRQMSRLLAPLGKEKRTVMSELLESVKTEDLTKAYNRYLPAVLNEKTTTNTAKTTLSESVTSEKTGNRASKEALDSDDNAVTEIEELKRLLGN